MATASCADVYKCSSDNGRTVYQEQPCEKSDMKEVGKVKPPPESSSEERERMKGVHEKSKANLDANLEARAKREEKKIEERKAASQRGQVTEGGKQTAPKPEPQKSPDKEKSGNNS